MISMRHLALETAGVDSKIDWGHRDNPTHQGWQRHVVVRMDGEKQSLLPASFQLISAAWKRDNYRAPSMVYMPEKNRLLAIAEYGPAPVRTVTTYSDDSGATWSEPRLLLGPHGEELGDSVSVGLTYLGDGLVALSSESKSLRRFSFDYGQTWSETAPVPLSETGETLYHWDPMLTDRNEDGEIVRLWETRWRPTGQRPFDSGEGAYSQGYLWHSDDTGRSWSPAALVPQWLGVCEAALIRAGNGNIVAACRTDNPQRFIGEIDSYSGLAVSISADDGRTWSELDRLYEFGRHHPSLVLLKNGDILMTYTVAEGYEPTPDGYPQFGIEAVISRDHGRSWNLDERFVLPTWRGKLQGENAWWGGTQATTTVLLPDGSLLTLFGTGLRNQEGQERDLMDLGSVRWRPR